MTNDHSLLQANIWKINTLQACRGCLWFIPIIVPLLQSNHLTLQEVFLLEGVYALCCAIIEIPSGYISDVWGRKNTLIIGSLAYIAAALAFLFGIGFWSFFVGEMFFAIAVSFYSGTADALTYDTLYELKREKEYRKIDGYQSFLFFAAEGAGSIFVGLLAAISLRAPVIATLIPYSIGFLVSLTLEEPKRQILSEKTHLQQIKHICTTSMIHNVRIRSIAILGALLGTLGMTLFWYTQPFQTEHGLPILYFGIVHAVIVGSGAIAAKYTHTMERWIDDRLFLVLLAVLMIGSCIGIFTIHSLWALVFFVFIRMGWSFSRPLTADLINRMTASDIRATVLSIDGLLRRLLFVIVAPLFGYLGDIISIHTAILFTGISFGIAIAVTFFLMRNVWTQIPK